MAQLVDEERRDPHEVEVSMLELWPVPPPLDPLEELA